MKSFIKISIALACRIGSRRDSGGGRRTGLTHLPQRGRSVSRPERA